MDSKYLFRIYRGVSHFLYFLMWEADELAFLLGPFVLFFAIKKPFVGLVIGVVSLKLYVRVKYNKQAGYVQHFLIKKGVLSLKELPAGYKLYL